ncbi:MAG: hypothetical protein ACLP5H_11640 [Desulfomonilaceae bacterium]
MAWKLAYHHNEDGEQQPGSPGIDYLVGCILDGCPVRVLAVRANDVLACDTVAVRVDQSSAPQVVRVLLALRPATNENCELNPVFGISAASVDTTGKYSQIDSSTRGRLSEGYFEMKWFIED